ncbi:MAG: hypothetical protein HXY50_00235 [Ignavibacteriaceae bacterium]|nr:hypothetical protein [Ignavibacteriaceae bacterium]
MKAKSFFHTIIFIVLFSFTFQVTLLTPLSYAQSINGVKEDIGGSGSSSNSGDSGSDNTFLYIAAGVIIIGLIVWKVVIDKKKSKTEDHTKPDSTKSSSENLIFEKFSNDESELLKIKNQLPVELFLGWKSNQQVSPVENLSFGLKLKL